MFSKLMNGVRTRTMNRLCGKFERALRRLSTSHLIELFCGAIHRDWLNVDELNELLEREGASFRFRNDEEKMRINVFSLEQLEEDASLHQEHPNVRLLVKRSKEYPAVLHASSSVCETLAKDIVSVLRVCKNKHWDRSLLVAKKIPNGQPIYKQR